ncbi:MAG: mercury methylation corrinoid protein HgcA [Armatimonadota bacterium]|jgi:acetyl-CoA decarbonylase/synthase complex subunit gamma
MAQMTSTAGEQETGPGTDERRIERTVSTAIGPVPRVGTTLSFADTLGRWKARWGIGRMRYEVEPGLYAVGDPTPESAVLVSANYKMSFDHLRSQLGGLDAWILVLDTRGINVWCAAGKGTFGTEELVQRVASVRLADVVAHRKLVVPQLGAPGVSAHEVRRQSGFRVVYGPVRAEDIPPFLEAGMKATPEMRRVQFTLRDRVALIPLELVGWAKYALVAAVVLLLLSGLWRGGYEPGRIATLGSRHVLLLVGAYVAGAALAPALLPWLPGRAFAAKGAWTGLVLFLGVAAYAHTRPGVFENWPSGAAWLLMAPAIASFAAMNFTGASTYTSLSGVRREMSIAVPAQIVAGVAGVGLWLAGRFL